MFIVAFIGYLGIYFHYYLLSKYDAGYVISIVSPLSIMVTVITGILFYGEEFSRNKIIGSIITCVGIVVMLFGKKTKK